MKLPRFIRSVPLRSQTSRTAAGMLLASLLLCVACACGTSSQAGSPFFDAGTQDAGLADAATSDGGPEVDASQKPKKEGKSYEVATFDADITDSERGTKLRQDDPYSRAIAYRIYYPVGASGKVPLLLVSHGGAGSTDGHTLLQHLGTHYAESGYVAVHLNHAPSPSSGIHRFDRPLDISFFLDELEAERAPLPPQMQVEIDLSRVGHAGHSWGAYTSHAVGGAKFDHTLTAGVSLRDARISAICPISPQGPDQFGAYDNGAEDNSWRTVEIPAFSLVGAEEKDGSAGGTISMADWRLFPFQRYPPPGDAFLSVLPGQDHGEMGNSGSPEVQAYIAENTRLFFDVYVRGDTQQVCKIGTLAPLADVDHRRKPDPTAELASSCP